MKIPWKYLTSCFGKVRYGHLATAKSAAHKMGLKHKEEFQAYACGYCCAFHIGHKPGAGRGAVVITASVKYASTDAAPSKD